MEITSDGDRSRKAMPKPNVGLQDREDISALAQRINENWRKTVEDLKVAQDCATAKKMLSSTGKQKLYELLPFKASMFSKLAAIGEDPRLMRHQDLLPVSISTIYEARKLSDDRFKAAIEEGALKPDVKREEFEGWVKGNARKDSSWEGKDLGVTAWTILRLHRDTVADRATCRLTECGD